MGEEATSSDWKWKSGNIAYFLFLLLISAVLSLTNLVIFCITFCQYCTGGEVSVCGRVTNLVISGITVILSIGAIAVDACIYDIQTYEWILGFYILLASITTTCIYFSLTIYTSVKKL